LSCGVPETALKYLKEMHELLFFGSKLKLNVPLSDEFQREMEGLAKRLNGNMPAWREDQELDVGGTVKPVVPS
jgi:hypothetical protein